MNEKYSQKIYILIFWIFSHIKLTIIYKCAQKNGLKFNNF